MRLYPPIWIIERRVIEEDVIGGLHDARRLGGGHFAHTHSPPPGVSGIVPEEFDPSRFESPPPAAYIPFGAGPRFCIGNEFAMLEAQLITVMVMQAFHCAWFPDIRWSRCRTSPCGRSTG